jgi:hypothetical protein
VLADVLFGLACVVAVVVLLYLGRYSTFFNDEWTFVVERSDWSLDSLMRPHNEHWSLTLALVYNALLSTVGLRTYLPYLLVLMLTHVAVASALFVLLRRHNGQIPALAGGTLMLFLGTGEDNLFWAFQMGFVGAAAAGAWAIVLLLTRASRRAEIGAAALLVVAVATNGTGLFFLAGIAAALIIDPVRRRQLWVVVPAAAVYMVWYLLLGSSAIGSLTLARLQDVPAYVVAGASYSIGRLSGWGEHVGLVLFVAMVMATAWHVSGTRRIRAAAVAGLIGLLAQLVLTGLVRAHLGVVQATSSRYVYVAAVLLLIAASGWIGSRFAELRVRPLVVLAAVLALALGGNLSALPSGRDAYLQRADATRAAISLIQRYGGSPAVSLEAGLYPIPGKRGLGEIQQTFGLPTEDAILPDAAPPSPMLMDIQLYALVADAFTTTSATAMPTSVSEPDVVASTDVSIATASPCIELRIVGNDPHILLRVPGGSALGIEVDQFGEGQAFLALHDSPAEANSKPVALSPESVNVINVPDVGDPRPWIVRFDPPAAAGTTRVCVVAGSDGSAAAVTAPRRGAPSGGPG